MMKDIKLSCGRGVKKWNLEFIAIKQISVFEKFTIEKQSDNILDHIISIVWNYYN